jgi:hypothetical protein
MAVFITDSNTAGSAVALVVGVKGSGESSGGRTGIGVSELESLHRSDGRRRDQRAVYDNNGEISFMLFLDYVL